MGLYLEKSQKAVNSLIGHTDGRIEKLKAHRKTIKTEFNKVSKGEYITLPGTELGAINVILWQRILLLRSDIWSEVKFKSNGPICLLAGESG